VRREKILVVEDEADILEVIQYNLAREGFQVICSGDGEEALRLVKREAPALILLDLMLPGVDGIELCQAIRNDPLTRRTPIIMVTAKGEETDVVLGLGVGADDYVVKPFSPKELVARVKAALRRAREGEAPAKGERVDAGPLTVDPARHEARLAGETLDLTPTEFRLLHILASHPGVAFSREEHLRRAVGPHAVVVQRNVDVHVRALRRKLGRHRDLIETVRGVGYRFKG
jgi:DNA-binding response OmpR family regulator